MESSQLDKDGKHLAFLKLQEESCVTEKGSSSGSNPLPHAFAPAVTTSGNMAIATDRLRKLSEDSAPISGPVSRNIYLDSGSTVTLKAMCRRLRIRRRGQVLSPKLTCGQDCPPVRSPKCESCMRTNCLQCYWAIIHDVVLCDVTWHRFQPCQQHSVNAQEWEFNVLGTQQVSRVGMYRLLKWFCWVTKWLSYMNLESNWLLWPLGELEA